MTIGTRVVVCDPNLFSGRFRGLVGVVAGPVMIARAYEFGWDDLGVVRVLWPDLPGVDLQTHWSNLSEVNEAGR